MVFQVNNLGCVPWTKDTITMLDELDAYFEGSELSPCITKEDTVPFEDQSDRRSPSFEGKLM